MKILLSIAFISLLYGCTAAAPVKPKEPIQGYVEFNEGISFSLKDMRTPESKMRDQGSNNPLSCELGILRFEDSITIPDRITYLKSRLEQEANNLNLSGKEIEILKFSASVNTQVFMRSRSKGVSFSSDADAIVAQEVFHSFISKYECWKNEEEIGGYDLSLNTQLQPVGVVDFSARVEGKVYDFKEVFVPHSDEMNLPIIETAIFRATNTFLQKLGVN
ncbi:hypothetical protein [Neptuniibacter pectenicola]|uniref:hypothetical protein n=1 Tax=Neptuniibacter pectenicola TaxID=1806669 RepID=UPI00082EFC25|nr:hypothetical protein [Neptuniibacter pectenicola]